MGDGGSPHPRQDERLWGILYASAKSDWGTVAGPPAMPPAGPTIHFPGAGPGRSARHLPTRNSIHADSGAWGCVGRVPGGPGQAEVTRKMTRWTAMGFLPPLALPELPDLPVRLNDSRRIRWRLAALCRSERVTESRVWIDLRPRPSPTWRAASTVDREGQLRLRPTSQYRPEAGALDRPAQTIGTQRFLRGEAAAGRWPGIGWNSRDPTSRRRRVEAVAHAVDRRDAVVFGAHGLQLAPQVFHVGVDGAVAHVAQVAVGAVQQLRA